VRLRVAGWRGRVLGALDRVGGLGGTGGGLVGEGGREGDALPSSLVVARVFGGVRGCVLEGVGLCGVSVCVWSGVQ